MMFVRFYKVGKFLHLIAAIAFILAVVSIIMLREIDYVQKPIFWFIWMYSLVVFSSMAILAEMDGFSRFQNYKQVKDQIYFNGYQERLLKPLTRSSCQREAAILACAELGLGNEATSFFYDQGYRWYHIIPDFVFQYPMFFFSKFFWRTTFFTPYYKAKLNYDQIDITEIDFISIGLQREPTT